MSSVSLVNAAPDAGVAHFLETDLSRQGVSVTRGAGSGPLLLVVGPASASDPGLQAEAARAAEAGRPIHVVRLGQGRYDWPSLRNAASWTDAFGPAAEANVGALAARLRQPSQASPWGAPPAAPPSPWAGPSAAEPFRPAPHPVTPPSAGAAEPSDKGSLIALAVIGSLGLVVLVLYLTGMLGSLTGSPATGTSPTANAPTRPGPAATAGVTDQWLTGTWKDSCASPEFMRLDLARGTVTFHNGGGRVRRNGNILTISGGGGSIVMTVAYAGPDQMIATAQGDSQTLYRCN